MLYKAKGLMIELVAVTVHDMGTKKVPRYDDTLPAIFFFFCLLFEKLEAFVLVFKSSFLAIAYHQATRLVFFHRDCLKLKQTLCRHAVFHQNRTHDLDLVVKNLMVPTSNHSVDKQTPGKGC